MARNGLSGFAGIKLRGPPDPSPRHQQISEQKELALEWLSSGGTVSEAAQYAGVRRQTVSHWLHHDAEFRELFRQWKQQADVLAVNRLLSISESAFATLAAQIREKRDSRLATTLLRNLDRLSRVE